MKKSIHSDEYSCVLKKLIEMRETAGLTQRALAEKLGREYSFVWRIEHGERRLDVVEFFWVCEALGQDAKEIYGKLADEFRKISG
jgi:transcriptional regulator with XRE-family HTH domain